jgi:hypothetical protein
MDLKLVLKYIVSIILGFILGNVLYSNSNKELIIIDINND